MQRIRLIQTARNAVTYCFQDTAMRQAGFGHLCSLLTHNANGLEEIQWLAPTAGLDRIQRSHALVDEVAQWLLSEASGAALSGEGAAVGTATDFVDGDRIDAMEDEFRPVAVGRRRNKGGR